MKYTLLLFSSCILIMSSCKKESIYTEDCSGTTKSFAMDVNPIVQTSCSGSSSCHASGSSQGPGALLSYAQISGNKSNIKRTVANGEMPQGSTLTSDQKNAIICWINNGAPNN